jgi:hypothetical protein
VNVAVGLKAHSGWAALMAVAECGGGFEVVGRRRIDLVEENQAWAKQPCHAAEDLQPREAQELIIRGIESSRRVAGQQLAAVASELQASGHNVIGCAVLMPAAMPKWSIKEILAVHVRMHKAEGVVFPEVLCQGAEDTGLSLWAIPEKELWARAVQQLGALAEELRHTLSCIGKAIGPPWTADQKGATLAAMMVLSIVAQQSVGGEAPASPSRP